MSGFDSKFSSSSSLGAGAGSVSLGAGAGSFSLGAGAGSSSLGAGAGSVSLGAGAGKVSSPLGGGCVSLGGNVFSGGHVHGVPTAVGAGLQVEGSVAVVKDRLGTEAIKVNDVFTPDDNDDVNLLPLAQPPVARPAHSPSSRFVPPPIGAGKRVLWVDGQKFVTDADGDTGSPSRRGPLGSTTGPLVALSTQVRSLSGPQNVGSKGAIPTKIIKHHTN
jgi:hypothetical protein